MANIRDIIARVDDIKPNAFTDNTKLAWIGELDGRIAADVMLMGIEDIRQMEYTYPNALDAEPLVGFPHDGIYEQYLCAKVDYANGEYSKYQNSMEMFNAHYEDFVNWFIRTYAPGQGYPCGTIGKGTYYISAYGLAVTQGYTGTLQQWLESLHGAELELRCVDNMIQWRLKAEPEEEWQDLVSVAEFQREAEAAAKRAGEAAAKLEGGLVLQKGDCADSIVQVPSVPGGNGEDPTPKALSRGAISLGRYTVAGSVDDEGEDIGREAIAVNYQTKAYGRGAFAANIGTIASQMGAASFGGSNAANGLFAFCGGGTRNKTAANQSFVTGDDNEITEEGVAGFAANTGNEVTAPNAAAFGTKNKAAGDSSFVAGGGGNGDDTGNEATALNAAAFGTKNTASGISSMAVGNSTLAQGNCSFAGGISTQALGGASFASGINTITYDSYAYAGGNNTETEGFSSFAHGSGLRTIKERQAAFGNYNAPADNLLFMVGNGTAENDRKNAFAVKKRSIVIDGVELTADTVANIATKSYIEEYINNLGVAEGAVF